MKINTQRVQMIEGLVFGERVSGDRLAKKHDRQNQPIALVGWAN
ncbi:hypothetical protein [Moorena sp. SIOASIH]|nr:hypothetical protein [Moorena sp. SIOASIH]